VEQNNCLGIHLSRNHATAVVLSGRSSHPEIVRCFSVRQEADGDIQDHENGSPAAQIAAKLASEGLRYGDVTVSLDCALYTRHNLHSSFTEHKQIANTIIFDAEDALARDAMDMAVTFTVTGSDPTGSDTTVFAADRQVLRGMLDSLQAADLDPTAVEPDILCLARFLEQYFTLPKDVEALFVVLSERDCHIIRPQRQNFGPLVRSFMTGPSRNNTMALAGQITLTLAAMNEEKPVDSLFLLGETEHIDIKALSGATGIEAQEIDMATLIPADKSLLADCAWQVELAMACGAATAPIKHIKPSDFRRSFAPYQGKKMILQRALRATSVFVSISMIVLGLYFQLKVIRINKYVSGLERNLQRDYSKVMYGAKPRSNMSIVRQLARKHAQIQNLKKGDFGDEGSVPAKLTYMLEAVNKSPKAIDLHVSSVDVTTKQMSLTGDTNRRASTLALFNSFKSHPKLVKTYESYDERGNRDSFTIHLSLKKGK